MLELRERHEPYWRPIRDSIEEQLAFIAGERFADDSGAFNRDRRAIQIRGMELADSVASVAAQSTAKPRNVEPRALGKDDDPEAGEAMASLVESILSDPWRSFDDYYEAAIVSAREAQLGIVWMDYVEDYGEQGGEIFFSFGDPRRFMWDEGYEDPHHPLCGWLIREVRKDVDTARDEYGAKWLEPDRNYRGNNRRNSSVAGFEPGAIDDDKVTLWECWWKNDRSTRDKTDANVLKPAEQYQACVSGCGYRTEPGKGQPEHTPQGCPTCGGDLQRIDALDVTTTSLLFTRGRRLTVVPPYCSNPKDGDKSHVYDGAWPIPRARSFPGLFITARIKGGHPMGTSDTIAMWDQQIASDVLASTAIQRILEHRNYWVLPRAGVVDYRNKRFEFRDDQFNVMYRDQSTEFGPNDIEQIGGTGLDPNFAAVWQITQQKLTQYRGVTDLGITPDTSKNIAVGTIQEMVKQGSMQIEHFDRRKCRALGKFYGVCSDYASVIYTPARLQRLNLDGVDILARMNPEDLGYWDFVLTDSAPFTGVEKERANAAKELIAMSQQTPLWDLYAELTGAPASVVRKIEKRLAQMAEQQAQAAQAGMGAAPGMDPNEAQPGEELTPGDLPGDDSGPGMVPGLMSPDGAGMIQ